MAEFYIYLLILLVLYWLSRTSQRIITYIGNKINNGLHNMKIHMSNRHNTHESKNITDKRKNKIINTHMICI